MSALTHILRFFRAYLPVAGRFLATAGLIALIFPLWTMAGGFGHVTIILGMKLWFILLLAAMGLGIYSFFQRTIRPDWLCLALTAGLMLVSITAVQDSFDPATGVVVYIGAMRYVGPIIGILIGELGILALGYFALFGTFIGLAPVAPITPQLDFPDVENRAKDVAKALFIAGFWLGLFGAGIGIGAARLPWELTLIALLLAIVVIPGNLAIPGDLSFRITFNITAITLVALVLGAAGYLIHTIIPWIEKPPAIYYTIGIVLVVLWVAALGIAVKLKQGWISKIATLVVFIAAPLVAAGLWYFSYGGIAIVNKFLAVPDPATMTQGQTIYWSFVMAGLAISFLGLIAALIMDQKKAFGALILCAVIIGGGHYANDLFWGKKTVKGSVEYLEGVSGYSIHKK